MGKDRLDAEFVAARGVLGRSIEVTAGARFEKLEQKILQGWQRTAVFRRTREALELRDHGNLTDVVANVTADVEQIEQTKLLNKKLLSSDLVWHTRRAAKKASRHASEIQKTWGTLSRMEPFW